MKMKKTNNNHVFRPLNLLGGSAILYAAFFLVACGNSGEGNQQTGEGVGTVEVVEAEGAEGVVADGPIAVLSVEKDAYDFGMVEEGAKIEHVFTFKNTGDAPLIISQVSASCGCTTPEYSKHPVAPGQTGTVKVVFDSSGQMTGQQHKIISILSNASKKVVLLHLRGEVTRKS